MIRRLALDMAEGQRPGRFTRVSESFLERVDAAVVKAVAREVQAHPSVGKTLK